MATPLPDPASLDAAAALFDEGASAVAGLSRGNRDHFGADTLLGGALTELCHLAVAHTEQEATSLAAALREVAATCRHRASAIRHYHAAMETHRQAELRWRTQVANAAAGAALPPRPAPPRPPRFTNSS